MRVNSPFPLYAPWRPPASPKTRSDDSIRRGAGRFRVHLVDYPRRLCKVFVQAFRHRDRYQRRDERNSDGGYDAKEAVLVFLIPNLHASQTCVKSHGPVRPANVTATWTIS